MYNRSTSRWNWIAVAALAFLAGHGHAESAGKARVVIDQRTGTVVITENVRIGTVAVAHGNFAVRVAEASQVSQPGPFARAGETVVVPRTRIRVDEGKGRRLVVLPRNVTLRELVDRLNALGVGPRDLAGVLQAIKSSGALQAEIVVR
ncbi:MAG: flagellar basal body P-ring protein FlgI [Gemmatimonadales bacterium]